MFITLENTNYIESFKLYSSPTTSYFEKVNEYSISLYLDLLLYRVGRRYNESGLMHTSALIETNLNLISILRLEISALNLL